MEIKFTFGAPNLHVLEYRRSAFWGTEKLSVDGTVIKELGLLSPSTHIHMSTIRRYEFDVGQHRVLFERERPVLFAAFLPHKYRIYVNGTLLYNQEGY